MGYHTEIGRVLRTLTANVRTNDPLNVYPGLNRMLRKNSVISGGVYPV